VGHNVEAGTVIATLLIRAGINGGGGERVARQRSCGCARNGQILPRTLAAPAGSAATMQAALVGSAETTREVDAGGGWLGQGPVADREKI
jgi:hypothetical protein